ncbi:MAG: hypothetical protein ACRD0A_10240 [Acidimicrobiales bacterium]
MVDADVVTDDDGHPEIGQGVARDRVISHSDPEMRHGRKSSSRRFDGHKLDAISDEDSELILGVDVRAGNAGDGEGAAPSFSGSKGSTASRSTCCWATWPTATATYARRLLMLSGGAEDP